VSADRAAYAVVVINGENRWRWTTAVAVGVSVTAVAALTACSSSAPSSVAPSTPATVTTNTAAPLATAPTSTTLQAPATTAEATTSLRPTVVTALVATPTTHPTTTTTKPKATKPTTPPTSTATSTADANATSTSGVSTGAAAAYLAASAPTVPSSTKPVPSSGSLPDGVYYATAGAGGPAAHSVVFQVEQLFVGQACTDHFGAEAPDSCMNNYGVEASPKKFMTVTLANQRITVVDGATQKNYRISGAELFRLISGEAPSAAAPAGYEYTAFSYFMTISGGAVTRLTQWWTP